MAASGAKMIEVGTTNRTRLSDFEQAIIPDLRPNQGSQVELTIEGFTEEVSVRELTFLHDHTRFLFSTISDHGASKT
jgi:L-seryl-tRNA(Ser) seleniumtransferase